MTENLCCFLVPIYRPISVSRLKAYFILVNWLSGVIQLLIKTQNVYIRVLRAISGYNSRDEHFKGWAENTPDAAREGRTKARENHVTSEISDIQAHLGENSSGVIIWRHFSRDCFFGFIFVLLSCEWVSFGMKASWRRVVIILFLPVVGRGIYFHAKAVSAHL